MPASKKRHRASNSTVSAKTKLRLSGLAIKRLLVILVLGFITAGVSLTARSIFTAQQVLCQIEAQNCPSDVTSTLTQLHGTALISTNIAAEANTILTATPYRVTSWYSTLPGTLHLEIAQDPTAYRLQTSDADVFVSTSGIVTTATAEVQDSVLRIATDSPLEAVLTEEGTVRSTLHTSLRAAAETTLEIPVADAQWYDQTLQLNLSDGFVILMLVSDVQQQLERATLVLDSPEFAERAAEVSVLDLRFRLPVLRNSL